MSATYISRAGKKKLVEDLKELKKQRDILTGEVAEAREKGDLKENAEYHAAKDQQGFSEGRIKEIEGKLGDAQVIDITRITPTGKVIFGTTVTLIDIADGSEKRYRIVGEDEADIKEQKISVMSPLARAMVGKSEGDAIVVQTPNGEHEYEIERVEYI